MLRLTLLPCGRRALLAVPVRSLSTVAVDQTGSLEVKSYQKIPGPRPLPLIGNAWRFMPIIGEFHNMDFVQLQSAISKKYAKEGKIAKLTGIPFRKDMVFLYDPDDIEKAFRNEGQWPIRDGIKSMLYYREELKKDFFKGELGAIFTQGKEWQDFRTKVNQPMMQPRSAKLYVSPINDVTEDFIDIMKSLRNDRHELPPDLIHYLNRWSLESISTIALDTRLGCLQPNLPKDSEPQKMIDAVQVMFQALYELDFLPRLRHFTKYKIWDDLVNAMDTFNEVAMKNINLAIERIKNKSPNDSREHSILERLLLNNDSPLVACVMALDMMTAGIDTTANASAVLLHYLARNQDKQQKLFEEIVQIVPEKKQKITSQNLDDMKYLKACVKESMRLTPIAPGNLRESVTDIVLGKYQVPKGKDVIMCFINICNDKANFNQPDRFIPERWLKGDEMQQKTHPFIFMPFGFGPRMCLGRRFAQLELETLTVKVIRNFRVSYDQELKMRANAVNQVVSPLSFQLEDRP